MEILLTNDDGIFAPGIRALYAELCNIGNVTVIAPSKAQSAMSHSISLSPISIEQVTDKDFCGYSVSGSPADCVKLAVKELMPRIDLVVSGINDGANVGTNICYSGTVAAAMEAAFHKIPSVAISAALEEKMNFELSVGYGIKILQSLLPLEVGDIININIPPLANTLPRGVKIEPQSIEGFDEKYISSVDKSGKRTYQIQAGPHRNKENNNDTNSLMDNFITITALHYDMTEYKRNEKIKDRLKEINIIGDNNGCQES